MKHTVQRALINVSVMTETAETSSCLSIWQRRSHCKLHTSNFGHRFCQSSGCWQSVNAFGGLDGYIFNRPFRPLLDRTYKIHMHWERRWTNEGHALLVPGCGTMVSLTIRGTLGSKAALCHCLLFSMLHGCGAVTRIWIILISTLQT